MNTDNDFNKPTIAVTTEDIAPDNVLGAIQRKRMELLLSDADVDKDRLMLMRDLSSTAVNQKRIVVEKDSAEGNKELALAMTKHLMTLNKNPYEAAPLENFIPPTETITLPAIELTEGELATELEYVNFSNTGKLRD